MQNTIHNFELPKIEYSNDTKLPRLRTLDGCYEEIRKLDKNTAISKYYIRQLVVSGVLPRIKSGKKYYINLDLLIEYLTNPDADKFRVNTHPASDSGIRKII